MKVIIDFESTKGIFNIKIGENGNRFYRISDYEFFTEGDKVGIKSNKNRKDTLLIPQHYSNYNNKQFNNRLELTNYLNDGFYSSSNSNKIEINTLNN